MAGETILIRPWIRVVCNSGDEGTKFGRFSLPLNNNATSMNYHYRTQEKIIPIGFNREIYDAQIDTLYQQTPMVLTVNLLNSSLVAVVLTSNMGQALWLMFLR